MKRGTTPLSPLPLIGPAFSGLNTELVDSVGLVDMTWALVLENVVWGSKGKPETRKGYVSATVTPATGAPIMWNVHEYVKFDQTTSLVAIGSNFAFYVSNNDGATWAAITGSVVTTTVRWVFVNFNGDLYATAPGHKIHRYTGAGVLTEISTSPVTNGVMTAAYGRIWAAIDASEESTVRYCALLDGTDWTGTAAGNIDASNAWTNGFNNIYAMKAFGAAFVILGSSQILVYVDGSGSELGIDPDNMYVVDTIEGTGTVHRDSVINIGEGDLWFLGPQGIQSLGRLVGDKTNPLTAISKNVFSLIRDLSVMHTGSDGNIKAVFYPKENMALYLFPESQRVVIFDTKRPLEDGTYRCAQWTGVPYYSLLARRNLDLVFGIAGGEVARYEGYRDDSVTEYHMTFASPWMDFGAEAHNRLKILKEVGITLYGRETLTGTLRWAFDFRPLEYSTAITSDYVASGGEYAIGEYGEDEYGEGLRNRIENLGVGGEGQYVKVWVQLKSDDVDSNLVLQELTIYAKPGKMV